MTMGKQNDDGQGDLSIVTTALPKTSGHPCRLIARSKNRLLPRAASAEVLELRLEYVYCTEKEAP